MNFHTSNNEKEGVSNISQFDTPAFFFIFRQIANLPIRKICRYEVIIFRLKIII